MKGITGVLLAGAVALGLALGAPATPRPSTGSRTARRPTRSGPTSSPGAEQWANDTGNTVNTSFHNGDVAAHQEAVRAAIAANADGIVTTSPDPGSLVEVAKEANERRHPDHQLQHPRPDRELRRLRRRRQRHLRHATGRSTSSTTSW